MEGVRKAAFDFEVDTHLSPVEAWRRVADVSQHGQVVPLTVGSGPTPQQVRVGSRLVARTALGPVGFDDVMIVREADEGRRLVLEKVGQLLGGLVTVSVAAHAGGGARVAWRQSIELPWLANAPAPVRRVGALGMAGAAPLIGWGYRAVVTRLVR